MRPPTIDSDRPRWRVSISRARRRSWPSWTFWPARPTTTRSWPATASSLAPARSGRSRPATACCSSTSPSAQWRTRCWRSNRGSRRTSTWPRARSRHRCSRSLAASGRPRVAARRCEFGAEPYCLAGVRVADGPCQQVNRHLRPRGDRRRRRPDPAFPTTTGELTDGSPTLTGILEASGPAGSGEVADRLPRSGLTYSIVIDAVGDDDGILASPDRHRAVGRAAGPAAVPGDRLRGMAPPNPPATACSIVGGGFGGLYAARQLGKDSRIDLTLVDRRNFHLFQPLLYQVATGARQSRRHRPAAPLDPAEAAEHDGPARRGGRPRSSPPARSSDVRRRADRL